MSNRIEFEAILEKGLPILKFTSGEKKASLSASLVMKGRDELAFDCFMEELAFQRVVKGGRGLVFDGACSYGSLKAVVTRPAFGLAKVQIQILLKPQGQLDSFYFTLKGQENCRVKMPMRGGELWYSKEWPMPCAALCEGEDAICLIPDPISLAARNEWLWQLEQGSQSLRLGCGQSSSWPLSGKGGTKKIKLSFYVAVLPVQNLASALPQLAWHVSSGKKAGIAPDIEELKGQALKKLPELLQKALNSEGAWPVSFGTLMEGAFVLAKSALKAGTKAPEICNKTISLYLKAPKHANLPPETFPWKEDFAENGLPETNVGLQAKAACFAALYALEIESTPELEAHLASFYSYIKGLRRAGAYVPAILDNVKGQVKKGTGKSRQNPYALLFLQAYARYCCQKGLPTALEVQEFWPGLLNASARSAFKREAFLTAEECLLGGKCALEGYVLSGREAYRALGVKFLWRSQSFQQIWEPPYLASPVMGLLCSNGPGRFDCASEALAPDLWAWAGRINGALSWGERSSLLRMALQKKQGFLRLEANTAKPSQIDCLDLAVAENAALLWEPLLEVPESQVIRPQKKAPEKAEPAVEATVEVTAPKQEIPVAKENKEKPKKKQAPAQAAETPAPDYDVFIDCENEKVTVSGKLSEARVERELLGFRLLVKNGGSKFQARVKQSDGFETTVTLKKGPNEIEIF